MDALIVIFITGLIGLFAGLQKKPSTSLIISLVGLTAAAIIQAFNGQYNSIFGKYQSLSFDENQINFSLLCIVMTMLILIAGFNQVRKDTKDSAEIMSLFLFSLCGALCLIGFQDLSMFFLGLEILSIPLYVLAGANQNNKNSIEASIKYFFTGSFMTCFLIMGIAFVYGATGKFDLVGIQEIIAAGQYSKPMLIIGVFFIVAALLFKVGAVPFHFWAPDVYQGSPDYVTAFMASVVKVAMLYTFYKFLSTIFIDLSSYWSGLIYISIVLSLFIGYLAAIGQTFYKRLIAYSSITHTAFALFSLLAIDNESVNDLFIFTIGYGFSVIALVTVSMATENDKDEISYLKGISRKYPIIGVVFIFALLSLTGIPPFTGFFGKSLLFYNAFSEFPLLVLFGIISTAIGGYFYLNMIFTSYSPEPNPEQVVKLDSLHYLVLSVCGISILSGWLFML
jgi:NADH-quinone oxidoreductase subunit N